MRVHTRWFQAGSGLLLPGRIQATAETRPTLFGESDAMVEGEFVGRHIGEFAGIAATGKHVLMAQLGVSPEAG